MRVHAVVLVLLCINSPFAARSQETSLYLRSLTAYAQAGRPTVQDSGVLVVVKNNVVDDPALFYPLPTNVGSIRVEFVDDNALRARYRENKKAFWAIEIKPMVNRANELIVDCQEYRAAVRRGKVTLSVMGGVRIHWRFDSQIGDYVLTRVEPWKFQM